VGGVVRERENVIYSPLRQLAQRGADCSTAEDREKLVPLTGRVEKPGYDVYPAKFGKV